MQATQMFAFDEPITQHTIKQHHGNAWRLQRDALRGRKW